MPRLALSPVPPERADADLLVLPVAGGEDGPVAPPVTAGVLGRLGAEQVIEGSTRAWPGCASAGAVS